VRLECAGDGFLGRGEGAPVSLLLGERAGEVMVKVSQAVGEGGCWSGC